MHSENELGIFFGTRIPSRQIRLYVEASGGGVGMDRLLEVFAVYGRQRVCNMVQCLCNRRFLAKHDRFVEVGDCGSASGSKADAAWRAAKMLHEFTIGDIAKTAGVAVRYAQRLLLWWAERGYVVKVVKESKGCSGVYRMPPDAPALRPLVNKKGGRHE